MSSGVQEPRAERRLDLEAFRTMWREELRQSGGSLAGWLESQVRPGLRHAADDFRPFTAQGRVFMNFSETLAHVLAWYKPEKIRVFNQRAWTMDPAVSDRVRARLASLIEEAVAETSDEAVRRRLLAYPVDPLAAYTAVDHLFQTLTRAPIRTVLDFGSGIGRQAFAWCEAPDVTFYSIDAIESLYLLQHEVYRRLFPERLVEYFLEPDGGVGAGRLFHLPTWRMDRVPDGSVDLIVCVQVLQEIPEVVLRHALEQFRRIASPGGFLYIRDKEFWTPAHQVRVGRELLKQGWRLLFRFTGDEGTEIEGTPRLWVYTGGDHRRYFRAAARLKRAFLPSYRLSYGSWRDIGLPI